MTGEEHRSGRRNAFGVVLYIFSGLALALGALLLALLLGAARAVTGYDMFFQLAGIEQLAQVVLRPLQAGLINVGIVVFVLMLAIAGLLFTSGRLMARQASLAERVRALEEKIEMSRAQP
jgi:Na+-translocating ferredoxin:NAD+ oxidoreductase RnfE subunit